MKKIIALFCVCATIFLASCSSETSASAPTETPVPTPEPITETNVLSSLSIPATTKGYNPYLYSDILVEQPSHLLFEKIIEISPEFEIEYRLAEKVISNDIFVEITLRDGCVFSDGTPVTAEDIATSLRTAQTSARFQGRFANVVSVEAVDNIINITLLTPDSFFVYLLDIPILKSTEQAEPYPTANGRYTYGSDIYTFILNPLAPFPATQPETINLQNIASYHEMADELALGSIDYSILSENSLDTNISTSANYYQTNTLLFLGVNAKSSNTLCNTAQGRMLISELTDRNNLSTLSNTLRTTVARGALNPYYPHVFDTHLILPDATDTNIQTTMQALGYTFDEETQMYIDVRKQPATIRILVHQDSSHKMQLATNLVSQYASFGINTELITTTDFNSFLTLLQSNTFELYIGEIKLYNNMELTPFWSGAASYGIAPSETLLNAYTILRADASTANSFETIFASEMPYIPLLWRNGVVATDHNLIGVTASVGNPLYSLENLILQNPK